MNFGERIKAARKEAGLTQEQLGLRCGWSNGNPQSRIGNYEKNTRAPSAADLAVIAEALGKEILYFYGQDDTSIKETTAAYLQGSNLATLIEGNSDDVRLLREAIERVEDVLAIDNQQHSSEVKAKTIIAALHLALVSKGNDVDSKFITAALRAIIS